MSIQNKMNHIRLLIAAYILVMLAFPISAQESVQEKEDSVFTFRFFSGKDMFWVPVRNNGKELERLLDSVDRYKDKITGREIVVRVDGSFISRGRRADNRLMAKIRSNRVKSELITRKGLTEDCFITRNRAGKNNSVTVRFVPVDSQETDSDVQPDTIVSVADSGKVAIVCPEDSISINNITGEFPDTSVSEVESTMTVSSKQSEGYDMFGNQSVVRPDSRFALKTNLLDYAVLMPNLELEWAFANRWSAALEVQGAWYAKESPHKVYRLATVMPEVRYWVIDRSLWHGMYVGVFGGAGLYDLSNGGKGHEGEGAMVGLSIGYMWPIGKHLSLDAGIGAGYLRIRDKEYLPAGGHFLYQLTKDINYFGPLRLKLSLVWRIPKY
ncbi:MAG: DUF3575 domain-containing protein [Paramuribaculum sp.]|nr:DUF3575 domain-containing protein [Paramuribaculum sp.]